ncbi:angiopoietin-related protein 5-like [Spea bombifrons]|uniref:angiopoietin-related protein 5-like n=1 Tax=Spea bombifrons TaxID=233779 RepID=UPI002349AF1F|nr:angiopoietin-related protein 5-like [Spea bombifrons]
MPLTNLFGCLLLFAFCFSDIKSQLTSTSTSTSTESALGHDCSQIWERDNRAVSGIYTIKPIGASKPFQVFCKMDADGGWTLIQKHDGQNSLSFDRTWAEYKEGFGYQSGEHWLGLDKIYLLTNQADRIPELRINLGDFAGSKAFAAYSTFTIGSETQLYQLSLGEYSGNAGDAFRGIEDATNENGSYFSTIDMDNDQCDPCQYGDIMYNSCSRDRFRSGWWFNSCGIANLNGQWRKQGHHIGWASSVLWQTWKAIESLKFSKMYLRHH